MSYGQHADGSIRAKSDVIPYQKYKLVDLEVLVPANYSACIFSFILSDDRM